MEKEVDTIIIITTILTTLIFAHVNMTKNKTSIGMKITNNLISLRG